MRKDPTEFRQRFAAYKNGKKPYKNGRPEPIQRIDSSESDFAQRLRSPWRQEIWDWEGSGKAATHKMSSADNIVYPNVQTTKGGGLIDFTHPMWEGVVDPLERAIRNKDYVPMKTEDDAIWTGPNYKKYYPGFKYGKESLPKFGLGTEEGTLSTIINAVPWRGYARKVKTLINDAIKLVPGPAGMMTSVPEINFKTKEGLASYGDVVGTAAASYGRSYTRPNGWGQQFDKWADGLKLPNNRTLGNTLSLPGLSNTGISNKTYGRGMWGLGTLISLPDMYYDARQLYWDLKTPAEKYAK